MWYYYDYGYYYFININKRKITLPFLLFTFFFTIYSSSSEEYSILHCFTKSDLVLIIEGGSKNDFKGRIGKGGGNDKPTGFGGTIGGILLQEILLACLRHVCANTNTDDKSSFSTPNNKKDTCQ